MTNKHLLKVKNLLILNLSCNFLLQKRIVYILVQLDIWQLPRQLFTLRLETKSKKKEELTSDRYRNRASDSYHFGTG